MGARRVAGETGAGPGRHDYVYAGAQSRVMEDVFGVNGDKREFGRQIGMLKRMEFC
jgi:hypothetical protein